MAQTTEGQIGYGGGGSFGSYLSGYGLRVPAIAGITQPLLVPTSWLDFINEDYGFNVGRWVFAREHYTGEVAAPWRIAAYLIRKKIGETIEAFEERVLLADYTPYFGAVVDTLAGMLVAREDEADRVWGKTAKGRASRKLGPLGDVDKPDTILGRLMIDADGQHNSWETLWQLTATELCSVHVCWLLVDGGPKKGKDKRQQPRVKLVQAESVPNWRYDDEGVLVEAVVKEHVDIRGSVEDDPRAGWEAQWIKFDVNGWSRWHKVKATQTGNAQNPNDEVPEKIGEGTYRYVTRDGKPTVPMIQVKLPLKRNVGYMMARKANAIFNKESERDHLLRFATFPLLNIVAHDQLFKKVQDQMRLGARLLQVLPGQSQHAFIAPPADPAKTMADAIKDKIEAFYATAFREFASSVNRAGRDRVTATEVLAQREVGLEAFLAVLATAIDNAENACTWYIEQTVFPKDESKWGQCHVERETSFGPLDPEATITKLKDRYIGNGTVPLGRTGLIEAVKRIAEFDGIEYDEKEIAEAVDAAPLSQLAQVLTLLWPAMPDEMKAEVVAQFGEANGFGEHDAIVKGVLAEMKKQAAAAAAAPPGGGKPGAGPQLGPPAKPIPKTPAEPVTG